MYPHIICDTAIQHLIRNHVLVGSQQILASIPCKNGIEDIVDKSIISTNNWLMYGCCKPTAKPYLLTHVFDHELNDLNRDKYKDKKALMRLLSIRDHPLEESIPIKPEHKALLEKKKPVAPKTHKGLKITKLTMGTQSRLRSDLNLEEVRQMVQILNLERAESYPTWIEVGLCLHNIDISLLDSWIEFSQGSSKFKEGECEEVWANMEYRDDGLSVGSLHRWARMDNRMAYDELISQSIAQDIRNSQSQTTQDIARVVYDMYRYQFVCVSLKQNAWYEFRNHRWIPIDSAVTLKKKLGNEVVNEYLRMIKYYGEAACEQEDERKDQYIILSKNLADVTYKLREISFKDKIIKECQMMFYDANFLQNLDANPNLIGFENGVYDLSKAEFRDGRPEDYISLTTGNDYIEYTGDDESVQAINEFMSQVFPEKEVRDYVWILLASFLEGRNPNEKFHIWTGVGGNGKSKLLELFELAFGKYTNKIPVSTLTQKIRTQSNQASPEISRLKGIRAVSTQEPEEDTRLNVGVMKEWSGGDKLFCRALYSEPFEFKPQFKMIFCCNHLPTLPPDDEGTWRRVSVVEFKCRFVDRPDPNNPREFKKDVHLSEKLFYWKEAFMFMMLEHFKMYKKYGLVEPQTVKEATLEYQKMNDIYTDFISDCFEKDITEKIHLDDAFKVFREWWKDANSGKSPNRNVFKSCIEKKLGKYQRIGWPGYRLIVNFNKNSSEEKIISTGQIAPALRNDT